MLGPPLPACRLSCVQVCTECSENNRRTNTSGNIFDNPTSAYTGTAYWPSIKKCTLEFLVGKSVFSKISPSFIHADSQSESVSWHFMWIWNSPGMHSFFSPGPSFIIVKLHWFPEQQVHVFSVLVSVTCNDNVDVTEPCHALCHASGAQSLGQVICAVLNLLKSLMTRS